MRDTVLRPSRRQMIALAGAAVLCPMTGQADTLARVGGTAFGTTWQIAGPSGAALDRLRADIEALFADIDAKMSPWRQDSAISRINAAPAGWHAADTEVLGLLAEALRLAAASQGAFDPTVGPLVARWGFGPIFKGGAPDWRGVSIAGQGIRKARADLTLDLCGIAKGWALDQAAGLAREAGLDDLLLDLGGELAAIGNHPAGRPWRVAVEHPDPAQGRLAVLRLRDGGAVATSGLRAQSYTIGGRTYGHIIDPARHAPVEGALRSVTVLAANATLADGWATALFAAGETAGPALASEHAIDALFLVEDGLSLRQIATGAIGEVLS